MIKASYCKTRSALPSPSTSVTAITLTLGVVVVGKSVVEELQHSRNDEPVDNLASQYRVPPASYCKTRSALPSPSTSVTATTLALGVVVVVHWPVLELQHSPNDEPVDNLASQYRVPPASYCKTRSALPSPSTSVTATTLTLGVV